MIGVRKATPNDIAAIEEILLDAVTWLDFNGKHQWEPEQVKWPELQKLYDLEMFCLTEVNGDPVGCMALMDYDPTFWPDLSKGEALIIHKLAVKRSVAGKGISQALITYAKHRCLQRNISELRLDCIQDRTNLRKFYESQGFICVAEKRMFDKFDVALYICIVKKQKV